ncbi:MAG: TadE/TadG family type IV pilus assembly protein [Acidimicrobiales bacterium]
MATGKGQRGQAVVEFALVLPLVVLFALVVLQAALVGKDALLVHHAAREAARAAAVEPDPAVARRAALAAGGLDAGRLSSRLTGGNGRGDRTTATVTYRSPTNVPLVGRFVGDIELHAAVTMRVE